MLPASDELEVSIFGPGVGECIVLHVGDGAGKVGRLRIGRAVAEYFPGKTSVNSKTVTLEALLKFMKENGT